MTLNLKKYFITEAFIKLKTVKNIKFKIALIKIDVNGHEFSVVKGLYNVIKNKPALIIETDINIKKIEKLLKRLNYKKYFFKR